MENMTKIIGSNILKYRKSREMTREQLAEALNLDTAYLGQCERGERQLGLSKTIEIVQYFGITPNDIISINVEKKSENKAVLTNKINQALEQCSDNQLLAVLRCVTALLPFLTD